MLELKVYAGNLNNSANKFQWTIFWLKMRNAVSIQVKIELVNCIFENFADF